MVPYVIYAAAMREAKANQTPPEAISLRDLRDKYVTTMRLMSIYEKTPETYFFDEFYHLIKKHYILHAIKISEA